MNRRDFVGVAAGAALAPGLAATPASAAEGAAAVKPGPQLLELRRYRLRFGPMEARFAEYQKKHLVPALNRAGIQPVGAFSVQFGPDSPATYLLLPHPSADSVASLAGRIAADPEYRSGAAAFRGLPASDPPYVRRDGALLLAFDSVPKIEPPTGPLAGTGRVFELRTYESHNENASLKKVEMFEQAGEIGIFRRLGLTPVFFGRGVSGPALPALTYMLVYQDLAAREKVWAAFRDDPEWVKLRATPGYTNAEILTNVTNVLLRPTDYSQV
jgi:hypothetical protein